MSARERLFQAMAGGWSLTEAEAAPLYRKIDDALGEHAHELAEQQWAYAEEEWTGSDARMILRRRIARHLADLIDPSAGPVRPDEEPT